MTGGSIFILLALIVPALITLAILISPFWPWAKPVNRPKYAAFLGISLAASAVICGILYFVATRKVSFDEVWNFKITSMVHDELWTTEESYTTTSTDSEGNTTTTTHYYTQEHGPFWTAYDEYGGSYTATQGQYEEWKRAWGNQRHTGKHDGDSASWDAAITGQIYQIDWPGTFETISTTCAPPNSPWPSTTLELCSPYLIKRDTPRTAPRTYAAEPSTAKLSGRISNG